MNIDIGTILTQCTIAAVILWMSDRERKILLDRIMALEKRHEDLNKEYIEALRDWSGIDPKFTTWQNRDMPDTRMTKQGDTTSREIMIDDRERQKAIDLMNK